MALSMPLLAFSLPACFCPVLLLACCTLQAEPASAVDIEAVDEGAPGAVVEMVSWLYKS